MDVEVSQEDQRGAILRERAHVGNFSGDKYET